MPALAATIATLLRDVAAFAQHASGTTLRAYQIPPARAIIDSVLNHRGLSFVVMFPRQSGKNELQAQIECYLLMLYSQLSAEIVKASPTWRPQSINAMRRLERVLKRNLLTRNRWKRREGYIYEIGTASLAFLSAAPAANVVGATANLLLEIDEAQDVDPAKYDTDLDPMTASTNATTVFFGTPWTDRTLLHRELTAARAAQEQDGRQRVFTLTADDVAREVPAYGAHVAQRVAKLGRNHPLIRTQYYGEEIADHGGLFPPKRRALMQGTHPPRQTPEPGHTYAMLIDVAGEDENAAQDLTELANPARDSTTLTIIDVDLSTVSEPLTQAPTYRTVNRIAWTGTRHSLIYAQIVALAELWQPTWVIVDATGVGAGLASFLARSLHSDVIPYTFNASTKSQLAWDFIAIIETGRWRDYTPHDEPARQFWAQLAGCTYETTGPNQQIKWSVPENRRDPVTNELLHDDWIMSAALAAVIDQLPWGPTGPGTSYVIKAPDPIEEADRGRFG